MEVVENGIKVCGTGSRGQLQSLPLAHRWYPAPACSAIEALGFKYAVPELTDAGLSETLLQHISQGIFPVSCAVDTTTRACAVLLNRARALLLCSLLSRELRGRGEGALREAAARN
jgi:hypothetical protein